MTSHCTTTNLAIFGETLQHVDSRESRLATFLTWTLTRGAHFSHFSREREMVLRDISREIFLARNAAREIARKIVQMLANLDPNLAKI